MTMEKLGLRLRNVHGKIRIEVMTMEKLGLR